MQEIQNWRLERSRNKGGYSTETASVTVHDNFYVLGGEDHGFNPTPVPAVSWRNWQNKVRIVTYCVSSSSSHTQCHKYCVSSSASHTLCHKYCASSSSSHTVPQILCILKFLTHGASHMVPQILCILKFLTHTVPQILCILKFLTHTVPQILCILKFLTHTVPQSLPDTVLILGFLVLSVQYLYLFGSHDLKHG